MDYFASKRLFQHGMQWVECKHRLLENHTDAVAPYLAKDNVTGTKEFPVVESNAAARVSSTRVRQKTQYRQGSD